MNYTKTQFLNFWGEQGYTETWDGHKYNWSKEINNLIIEQIGKNKDKVVLEIGCGSGYWTKFLTENAELVYAIDLIKKPSFDSNNLIYIENDNLQFNCNYIEDNSIDFAFSFGVFCHLSLDACESYLKDVMRVLKKGGSAIFMYADSDGLKKFYNDTSVTCNRIYGDYVNYENIMDMIIKYDINAKKILEFRDSLVLIKK